MAKNYIKLSIVIPTYNRIEKLTRLLDSILESNFDMNRLEILVIDNMSTDLTHKIIKSRYPSVKVYRPGKNLYSAGGREYGSKKSVGEYIAFVDDDNILTKDCLLHIVEALNQDSTIGLCGPVMCAYDAKKTIWSAGGIITDRGMVYHLLGKQDLSNLKFNNNINVDYLPNIYVVRRKLIENGLKHNLELFPHNWAEQDYSLKVKAMGYKIKTIVNALEYHDVDINRKITRISVEKTYDQARARIVFRRLYIKGFKNNSFFWLIVFPASTLYYLRAFVKDKGDSTFKLISAYLKGTFNGVKQNI